MKDIRNDVEDLFDDDDLEFINDTVEYDVTFDEDLDDEDYDYDDDDDYDDEDDDDDGGSGGKKGLIIGLILLILIAAGVAFFFLGKGEDTKPSKKPGVSDENSSSKEDEDEEETSTTEEPTTERATMEAETDPDLLTLITKYYAAVQAADLNALAEVVDTTQNISLQKMKKRAEYIEGYSNIVCYTKEGLDPGDYLVFVSFDMKLINIETLAPALDYYYLETKEDGSLYICTSWSDAEDAHIIKKTQLPEVQNLIVDVNAEFAEALAKDKQLKDLVTLLNGGTPEEPTTPAPTTPEPTTPEATTPEETTPAPSVAAGQVRVHTSDGTSVRMRQSASTSSEIMHVVESGTTITLIEKGDTWSKVSYEDVEGYIRNDFLIFAN